MAVSEIKLKSYSFNVRAQSRKAGSRNSSINSPGLGEVTLRSGGLDVSRLAGKVGLVAKFDVSSVLILSLRALSPSCVRAGASSSCSEWEMWMRRAADLVRWIILTSLGERAACRGGPEWGVEAAMLAQVGAGGRELAESFKVRTCVVRSFVMASRKLSWFASLLWVCSMVSMTGASDLSMVSEVAVLTSVVMSSVTLRSCSSRSITAMALIKLAVATGEVLAAADAAAVRRRSASLRFVSVSSSMIHFDLIRCVRAVSASGKGFGSEVSGVAVGVGTFVAFRIEALRPPPPPSVGVEGGGILREPFVGVATQRGGRWAGNSKEESRESKGMATWWLEPLGPRKRSWWQQVKTRPV